MTGPADQALEGPGPPRETGQKGTDAAASATSLATPPGVFLMMESFETGGSERQFAALAKALDPFSFRVHLGCICKRGPFLEGLGDPPEFPLGGNLYGWGSIQTRFKLARHLRRSRIAIAHAFDFYTNLTLIPTALLARVPVVIGSQRQLGDLLSPAKSRAQVMAFRWCDRVVCNSRAAANRLIHDGLPEDKIVVIGNGLPPSAFAETPPALPRPSGLLRVGMIGRMNTPSKNHSSFLRAAARLRNARTADARSRDKFPALEFLLVGDGPLRPELEREAQRLGLGDGIRFLGDRRDIPAVLASMDVSVQPSSSESLSNVIIESMAAGVPVVANMVGGNPELVTETRGILVPPCDDEALANAIERLLGDAPLRIDLGRNAKQFAETCFTIEHMRRRHEDLYTELLERKRGRMKPRPAAGLRRSQGGPLRIAIVAASMRYVGGQSVQAELLLRNWRDDPDVQVKFIPIDPDFPRYLSWVEHAPLLRTLVRAPLYALALWRGLKDVEIAHIFSASYWSFLIAPLPAWLVARRRGSKTLVHYHSGEARDHLRRSRTTRQVLARTDRIVVPSGYLVKVFAEFGLPALAIPNIVDLSEFSFRERNPLRPHLVCTRGFHPYYGIDVVVRAFAEIKREFPDASLDLVGGGPLEAEIRGLVRELQLSGVNFAGVASRQEVAHFYDRAEIFINASRLDNMPVSILEAFAAGTPVVSTAPEGMRYLVEHERTGLLSEPGDADALARNVLRLLTDFNLASQLTGNAHKESQRYCWAAVRSLWLEVYRSSGSRPGVSQIVEKEPATVAGR